MTPVLIKVKQIKITTESGYELVLIDKWIGEKPIIVSDEILRELARRGDLR